MSGELRARPGVVGIGGLRACPSGLVRGGRAVRVIEALDVVLTHVMVTLPNG